MGLAARSTERRAQPNGLTTLVTPVPGRRLATVTAYYRTGSRYESEEQNGISHLLEHMLFRGTPSHPSSHALAAAFEDLGGTLLASTAADHGNLAITVPNENLVSAARFLTEVFRAPLLSDGLAVERAIVREEILEDYDDQNQLIDGATLVRQLRFGQRSLGQPITGPPENLSRLTQSAIQTWQEETHVASSLVVSAAGDIDVDALHDCLESELGNLDAGRRLPFDAAPKRNDSAFLLVRHQGSSQTALHLAYEALPAHHALEPALDMLLRVIDDGMSTRLYHRLCDTLGLCYDASASYESYEDTGLVEFETETAHEQAPIVLDELLSLVEELRQDGVTTAELDRTRRRVRWQFEAAVDDPGEVADLLGHEEFSGGRRSPAQQLDELLAVDLQQLRDVAGLVFDDRRRAFAAVGSPSTKAQKHLEELAQRSST